MVVPKKHRKDEIRNHGSIVPTLTESHEHYGGANVPMILSKVGVGQEYKLHENGCSTLRGMARHNNVPMVVADRTRAYAKKGRNLESPKSMTNALSSVGKDNLVVMPAPIRFLNRNQRSFDPDMAMTVDTSNSTGVMVVGNIYPSGGEAGKVVDARGVYPTVKQGKRGGRAGMPPIANTVDQDGYLRRTEHHDKPLCRYRIRRLTPRECERLQGFPDDWTRWGIDEKGNKIEISDTQRYKMMGNAVTVNVVEFLARRLMGVLG